MKAREQIGFPGLLEILPGLPRDLPRPEALDYILSRAYARALGDNLPRRDVLMKLAASMALVGLPSRPARSAPSLAPVAITRVAAGAPTIKVFRKTFGSFDAESEDDKPLNGYVMINVIDQNTNLTEGSVTGRYSFPANTTTTFNFKNGPAATTKGSKTLEVRTADDHYDDTFEAI